MAIAEVTIVPVGTSSASIGGELSRALKILENEKDIAYQMTSMGTVIEGELDRVIGLVRRMHEAEFSEGVKRVHTTITIDDRRDRPSKTFMPI